MNELSFKKIRKKLGLNKKPKTDQDQVQVHPQGKDATDNLIQTIQQWCSNTKDLDNYKNIIRDNFNITRK